VACVDGDHETLSRVAGGFRWHNGRPQSWLAGRLRVMALVDAGDGPTLEQRGDLVFLAHGAAPAGLQELQRGHRRFAALEWDGDVLRAGRDALGLAPLFYRVVGPSVWLATEVAPLVGIGAAEPDLEGLAWRAAGEPIEDRTGYAGVLRVLPGTSIELRPGRAPTTHRWWDPARLLGTFEGTRAHAVEELRERIHVAVGRCWGDRTGILLSGGLDSGAIAVAATGLSPPHLVHIRYPSIEGTDEIGYARAVAEHLGQPLHAVDGDVEPWDPDDELGTTLVPYQMLPLGLVETGLAHLAAAGITTALDGHDADGILGIRGGDWGELARRGEIRRLTELGRRHGVRPVVRGVAAEVLPPGARFERARHRGRATYAQRWATYFGEPLRAGILAGDTERWRRPGSWWELIQLYPLRPRATLAFEQREIQAARLGLDMRHPFADRELVELLLSLPCAVKCDPLLPKALLRDALADLLPPVVRDRPTKSDSRPIAKRRVGLDDCLERIRRSDVRLPHLDYDLLFRDGEQAPQRIPSLLVVGLARIHAFAEKALVA